MEFELVSNATDPVASFLGDGQSQFEDGDTSIEWQIENFMIKADVIELDSAVHNEYPNHLMQGNPIPINYTSFITQLQTTAGSDVAINITRSCSRLKQYLSPSVDRIPRLMLLQELGIVFKRTGTLFTTR